jgi:hypothetical protein
MSGDEWKSCSAGEGAGGERVTRLALGALKWPSIGTFLHLRYNNVRRTPDYLLTSSNMLRLFGQRGVRVATRRIAQQRIQFRVHRGIRRWG